ncbi:MAG: hypothetical protein JNN33_02265 [Rhodospirillaceae bacterium]|nr:hypothetical protein [Rhodospirillaceae bacterium]
MRKILAPILIAIALLPAACSSNRGAGGGGYGGTVDVPYGARAEFLAEDPAVIVVTIRDPLPAARVFLIDPTGVQTAAFDIQRDKRIYQSDSGAQPSIGVGVGGGSSGHVSTGIGIGFPIFPSGPHQTSAVIDSTAKVRIGNPVLYRTTWQSWKLRVELDDGVTQRVIETLPPKPL